jgi:hypothetical protein
MDANKIVKEIHSLALKEISGSLIGVIDRVQSGEIDFRQASVEVASHKHIIQTLALDWMYNSNKKKMVENQETKEIV